MALILRPATTGECSELSDLALRSKGHWGYEQAFLDACRAELTVTTDALASDLITVAETDGHTVGFYVLKGGPPEADLTFLFVEPAFMGTGIGRALWEHCVEEAANLGVSRIRIESDRFAESFYLRVGAKRIGETGSGSVAGRRLPLLAFQVDPET